MEEYKTIADFPELYLIRQKLIKAEIKDVESYFKEKIKNSGITGYFKSGATIGIAVGSRGIKDIQKIVRLLAAEIKRNEAIPVIIPSMGSHGGACERGQIEILNEYGITEEYTGAGIISNMDVVDIGPAENGLHVYVDKIAMKCDAVIAINRIKEHTDFYGETESGIMKMLAVGLGNHVGASYIHSFGTVGLSQYINQIAAKIINSKITVGIGIVEDGYSDIARIDILFENEICEKEKELLNYAKSLKPKIPFEKVNYLVIEEVGKNISGSGVDTKVIGRIRYSGVKEPESPSPDIIAGLRLTPESHGNAAGVGLLDLITKKFHETIDFQTTFKNGMTSKCPERYKIPMYMEDDLTTISVGMEFSRAAAFFENKILFIKNTGCLDYLYVSEPLIEEARMTEKMEVISQEPVKIKFNKSNEYKSLFEDIKYVFQG